MNNQANTMMTETNSLKITWHDLKAACEQAGIQDDDMLDLVDISWGSAKNLVCKKDEDFGWQIVMDCECE